MRAENCQLYLITPTKFGSGGITAFADTLASALDIGGVACVQLRLKGATDADIRRATEIFCPVAQERGVAFIINDRADIAAEMGCDGVHIGQDDISYDQARGIVGGDAIVGVTCKASRELAFEAGDAGADYVAFGAFFPSTTKETTTRADLKILAWWQEVMTVPCVAIGGITVNNCEAVINSGADFLAVSAGVWDYEGGPVNAIKAFNSKMSNSN